MSRMPWLHVWSSIVLEAYWRSREIAICKLAGVLS